MARSPLLLIALAALAGALPTPADVPFINSQSVATLTRVQPTPRLAPAPTATVFSKIGAIIIGTQPSSVSVSKSLSATPQSANLPPPNSAPPVVNTPPPAPPAAHTPPVEEEPSVHPAKSTQVAANPVLPTQPPATNTPQPAPQAPNANPPAATSHSSAASPAAPLATSAPAIAAATSANALSTTRSAGASPLVLAPPSTSTTTAPATTPTTAIPAPEPSSISPITPSPQSQAPKPNSAHISSGAVAGIVIAILSTVFLTCLGCRKFVCRRSREPRPFISSPIIPSNRSNNERLDVHWEKPEQGQELERSQDRFRPFSGFMPPSEWIRKVRQSRMSTPFNNMAGVGAKHGSFVDIDAQRGPGQHVHV